MFLILNIIPAELVAAIIVNYEKNTRNRLSICYKTILKFKIRLRDMIHISLSLILMES